MWWLLRLLALVAAWILARSLWRWLRGSERAPGPSLPTTHRGTFKRDPVCGAHLDASLAIQAVREGKTYYFCSPKCRDAFSAHQLTGVGTQK